KGNVLAAQHADGNVVAAVHDAVGADALIQCVHGVGLADRGSVVPDVGQAAQFFRGCFDGPGGVTAGAMSQIPADVGILLTQSQHVGDVVRIGDGVALGDVHHDQEVAAIRNFNQMLRHEVGDAAIDGVAGGGIEAIRLEADKAVTVNAGLCLGSG